MASTLDLAQQHLGPQEIQQISQQLGTDPATTQQAVNAALPAIVGGLASTAQQPGGASGILGQVLGRHQADVNQGVQQASGLDSDRTRKLPMILAPIVLAAFPESCWNTIERTSAS